MRRDERCRHLPKRTPAASGGVTTTTGPPTVAETTGGVAPVGHPAPIRTIVDVDLGQYGEVWAAGGHPHYVFPTTFDELVRITGGTPADVGA